LKISVIGTPSVFAFSRSMRRSYAGVRGLSPERIEPISGRFFAAATNWSATFASSSAVPPW
jgi:hypothetical protein